VAGLAASFGSGAMTNSFGEFSKAKLMLCIGTNMTEAHPVASYYVKQAVKNGMTLIVADPENTSCKVCEIFCTDQSRNCCRLLNRADECSD
jgi:formate dehydrogenase major subunit